MYYSIYYYEIIGCHTEMKKSLLHIAVSSDHVCGCCSVSNLDLSVRIVLISLLILT